MFWLRSLSAVSGVRTWVILVPGLCLGSLWARERVEWLDACKCVACTHQTHQGWEVVTEIKSYGSPLARNLKLTFRFVLDIDDLNQSDWIVLYTFNVQHCTYIESFVTENIITHNYSYKSSVHLWSWMWRLNSKIGKIIRKIAAQLWLQIVSWFLLKKFPFPVMRIECN